MSLSGCFLSTSLTTSVLVKRCAGIILITSITISCNGLTALDLRRLGEIKSVLLTITRYVPGLFPARGLTTSTNRFRQSQKSVEAHKFLSNFDSGEPSCLWAASTSCWIENSPVQPAKNSLMICLSVLTPPRMGGIVPLIGVQSETRVAAGIVCGEFAFRKAYAFARSKSSRSCWYRLSNSASSRSIASMVKSIANDVITH